MYRTYENDQVHFIRFNFNRPTYYFLSEIIHGEEHSWRSDSEVTFRKAMLCGTCCLFPSALKLCCILDFGMKGRQQYVCSAAQKGDAHTRPLGLHIAESDRRISLSHPLIVPPSELEIHNPRILEVQTFTNLQFVYLKRNQFPKKNSTTYHYI